MHFSFLKGFELRTKLSELKFGWPGLLLIICTCNLMLYNIQTLSGLPEEDLEHTASHGNLYHPGFASEILGVLSAQKKCS